MFRLTVVDATNRVHVMYRANPLNVVDRFMREVKRTAMMCADALPLLCWDHPEGSASRKEQNPRYKAGRDQLDADKIAETVRECLLAAKKQYCCWFDPQYEADDLIATICHWLPDWPLVIHSTDHDLFALLYPGIRVQITTSTSQMEKFKCYGYQQVEERYSIKIEQFLDYRALVGDSSDNLPGVKGIGKKTAVDILEQYPTVEAAVAAGDVLDISPRMRTLLKTAWDSGEFAEAKSIAALRKDAVIPQNVVELLELASKKLPAGRFNATFFEEPPF